MRTIPNLLIEVEALDPDQYPQYPGWAQIWGAEVLGRAIGHDLRWWLENTDPGEAADAIWYGDFIDPAFSRALIRHHIADVLL